MAVVLAMGGTLAGGCSRSVMRTLDQPPQELRAQLPEGTFARMSGDADRLVPDLRRAVSRAHWGLARLKPFRGTEASPEAPDALTEQLSPSPERFAAEAMLPDGRTARIAAASTEDGIVAGVRIGLFGSPGLEREFLEKLADTLAGPPPRMPRDWFRLPLGLFSPKPPTTQPP